MLNPDSASVRLTGHQRRGHLPLWRFKQKFTVGLRYDNIVVTMSVPTSFSARGKTPFSHNNVLVRHLHGGHCLEPFNLAV